MITNSGALSANQAVQGVKVTRTFWRVLPVIGLGLCAYYGCSSRGMSTDYGKSQALTQFRESRDKWGISETPNEKLVVERLLTRDCLKRVRSTLRPSEEASSIVAGNLEALNTTRQCWSVEVDTGFIGGLAAYFDDRGELLLAWRIPEG